MVTARAGGSYALQSDRFQSSHLPLKKAGIIMRSIKMPACPLTLGWTSRDLWERTYCAVAGRRKLVKKRWLTGWGWTGLIAVQTIGESRNKPTSSEEQRGRKEGGS